MDCCPDGGVDSELGGGEGGGRWAVGGRLRGVSGLPGQNVLLMLSVWIRNFVYWYWITGIGSLYFSSSGFAADPALESVRVHLCFSARFLS